MIVCAAALAGAQERMADQLKKGIVQEEANQDAEKAIQVYKAIVAQYDEERAVAATALYRLGECYRKAGMRSEAQAAYQRVVREFADQAALADSSRRQLMDTFGASDPRGARESQELLKAQRDLAGARQLLEEARVRDLRESRTLSPTYEQTTRPLSLEEAKLELAMIEKRMADIKAKVDRGAASPASLEELTAQYDRDRLRYAQLFEERRAIEYSTQAALTLNQQTLKSVQAEMKLVEQQIQAIQKRVQVGTVSPADPALLQLQRDLLALQRKADELNAALRR
jgi:tetratricopeptide (TPR) repeat protein